MTRDPVPGILSNAGFFTVLLLTSVLLTTALPGASAGTSGDNDSSRPRNIPVLNNQTTLPKPTESNSSSHLPTVTSAHEETLDDLKNSASNINNIKTESGLLNDQTATPTVTSVHQVWTSSSSGSLDELSPEIISKLRNDVPFLAAYALRPRLVGASTVTGTDSLVPIETGYSSSINHIAASPSSTTVKEIQAARKADLVLQTGASSPAGSHSPITARLSDFNELKVETSSTSKSEHHHKRKTVLKRKSDDDELTRKQTKRVSSAASQLTKKRNTKSNGLSKRQRVMAIQRSFKKSSRQVANGKSNKRKEALQRSQARTGRLRRKLDRRNLQHHMNIIRHGRQSLPPGTSPSKPESDVGGVKGVPSGRDEGAVKGGSNGGQANKRPFYARGPSSKPGSTETDREKGEKEEDGVSVNGLDGGGSSGASSTGGSSSSGDEKDESETDTNEDGAEDEGSLAAPVPKRVGDDDVEEDGDTVTVMPKFDGVDDDPEVPIEEGEDEATSKENEAPDASDDGRPENDPRTKRVNRERPNQSDGGQGSAAGGGIGATAGGGSNPESSLPETTEEGDDNDGRLASAGRKASTDGATPGVEFANDDEDRAHDDDDDGEDSRSASRGKSGGSGGRASEGNERETNETDSAGIDNDDDNDGDRRPTTDKSSSSSSGSADSSSEIDKFASKRKSGSGGSSSSPDRSGSDESDNPGVRDLGSSSGKADSSGSSDSSSSVENDLDYRDELDEAERKKKTATKPKSTEDEMRKHEKKDCDDGSYNHHDDHHHDHHDSIKWLQDAIPGEPNEDYPIYSRVNQTNFNCRDQKYPGYYADVDARCQVFHICQADGRQDSFLCPNGTIFSQISTVCVWWNSFDCEDAPKYYDLNALLYKNKQTGDKTSSSASDDASGVSDLRPINGARINPRDGSVENEASNPGGESSIDSLIRAMRRSMAEQDRKQLDRDSRPDSMSSVDESDDGSSYESGKRGPNTGAVGSGGRKSAVDIGSDDEASIQRKSTNIDDDSSGVSSRLRGNVEPRRKRRASVRQSPPKLKSRRVSRNSRRRKLRHGIKPKRRA